MQWKKSFIRTPYKMKNYYFYFFYNALIKWEGVLIFSDKQSEALCVIMYSLVEWFVTTLFLSLLKKKLSEK